MAMPLVKRVSSRSGFILVFIVAAVEQLSKLLLSFFLSLYFCLEWKERSTDCYLKWNLARPDQNISLVPFTIGHYVMTETHTFAPLYSLHFFGYNHKQVLETI